MNIIQALPIIEAHLIANEPIMLWGAPGVGKSDLVRQVRLRLKYDYLIDKFRAPTMDPVDICGVPSVVNGHTVWNSPDALPNEKRDGKTGIVFLDEINAGTTLVMASLFGFVLDRRVGNYTLPKGARIVAAGNRVSDKAAAQRFPTALANRFAHIDIDPDFDAWKSWANGANILPEIVAFLAWSEARGNSLLHKMPEGDARAFPTPRSWEKVSRVCTIAPAMAYQIAAANVGEAAAAEFKGFLDVYRQLPKLSDIIANPKTERVPLEPSAQYAVSAALSRAADAKTLASIVTYLERLPVEFSIMAMTDAIRRDTSLKSAPGFTKWAIANQSVTL